MGTGKEMAVRAPAEAPGNSRSLVWSITDATRLGVWGRCDRLGRFLQRPLLPHHPFPPGPLSPVQQWGHPLSCSPVRTLPTRHSPLPGVLVPSPLQTKRPAYCVRNLALARFCQARGGLCCGTHWPRDPWNAKTRASLLSLFGGSSLPQTPSCSGSPAHTRAHTRTRTHMHACTRTHTCTHARARTCTRAHTCAHAQGSSPWAQDLPQVHGKPGSLVSGLPGHRDLRWPFVLPPLPQALLRHHSADRHPGRPRQRKLQLEPSGNCVKSHSAQHGWRCHGNSPLR